MLRFLLALALLLGSKGCSAEMSPDGNLRLEALRAEKSGQLKARLAKAKRIIESESFLIA